MKYGNFKYGESDVNFRYPIWWDKTVTLFHRYEDDKTGMVTWYRKVLADCFWKCANNQLATSNTVAKDSVITVRIRKNDSFKMSYEWRTLPDKESYFTIDVGDIIVLGAISDTIDEYTAGTGSADLLNKYSSFCMTVQTVNINVHSGVGLPHYHITGG